VALTSGTIGFLHHHGVHAEGPPRAMDAQVEFHNAYGLPTLPTQAGRTRVVCLCLTPLAFTFRD